MKINRIDHVGVVVDDLPAMKAFFLDLGLSEVGEGDVEDRWMKRITGLPGMALTYAMLQTPDGDATIELLKFHAPSTGTGAPQTSVSSPGIRHICFSVEDIEGVMARMGKHGSEILGEVVNLDGAFKICYLRGPEGIVLELVEPLR